MLIPSDKKPELLTAKISQKKIIEGGFRNFPVIASRIDDDKQKKQTVINACLKSIVPVSYLKIHVRDSIDYYRPVAVQYLTDSFKTEKGWNYNYRTLTTGTLNSIEKNEMKFSSTILQKLKITVDNHDNKPLQIDSLVVKGFEYALIARFVEPADWYLTYGNNKASKPQYDIEQFADKIPGTLTSLKLGEEQLTGKEKLAKKLPLFQNKLWLWAVMAVIILVLGWFSVSMIRKR